jgi:hypothetical protein
VLPVVLRVPARFPSHLLARASHFQRSETTAPLSLSRVREYPPR